MKYLITILILVNLVAIKVFVVEMDSSKASKAHVALEVNTFTLYGKAKGTDGRFHIATINGATKEHNIKEQRWNQIVCDKMQASLMVTQAKDETQMEYWCEAGAYKQ